LSTEHGEIRQFKTSDWPGVWAILRPVFQKGETNAVNPDVTETEARADWVGEPTATYVLIDSSDGSDGNNRIMGTYYIKPNHLGPGAHVCNCGYIVGENDRGKGLATLMCEHSQSEAMRLGFRSMQFNLVVATNETAVRLWQKLGFAIVGTLPGVFRHPRQGFVDAYVMFKDLAEG
jgi:ribosomal protein S18 acetylase RimI-like enzyme